MLVCPHNRWLTCLVCNRSPWKLAAWTENVFLKKKKKWGIPALRRGMKFLIRTLPQENFPFENEPEIEEDGAGLPYLSPSISGQISNFFPFLLEEKKSCKMMRKACFFSLQAQSAISTFSRRLREEGGRKIPNKKSQLLAEEKILEI